MRKIDNSVNQGHKYEREVNQKRALTLSENVLSVLHTQDSVRQ